LHPSDLITDNWTKAQHHPHGIIISFGMILFGTTHVSNVWTWVNSRYSECRRHRYTQSLCNYWPTRADR